MNEDTAYRDRNLADDEAVDPAYIEKMMQALDALEDGRMDDVEALAAAL